MEAVAACRHHAARPIPRNRAALRRRREKDRHQENWRIFCGDVQVGGIGARARRDAMWDGGGKLPTLTVSDMTKCFCYVIINNKTSGDHIRGCRMDVA